MPDQSQIQADTIPDDTASQAQKADSSASEVPIPRSRSSSSSSFVSIRNSEGKHRPRTTFPIKITYRSLWRSFISISGVLLAVLGVIWAIKAYQITLQGNAAAQRADELAAKANELSLQESCRVHPNDAVLQSTPTCLNMKKQHDYDVVRKSLVELGRQHMGGLQRFDKALRAARSKVYSETLRILPICLAALRMMLLSCTSWTMECIILAFHHALDILQRISIQISALSTLIFVLFSQYTEAFPLATRSVAGIVCVGLLLVFVLNASICVWLLLSFLSNFIWDMYLCIDCMIKLLKVVGRGITRA